MTCLTELACAVYADGELSPEETRDAERHLAECPRCRARVAALRDENRSLASALTELDRVVEDAAAGPAFAAAPRAVMDVGRRNGRRAWLAQRCVEGSISPR